MLKWLRRAVVLALFIAGQGIHSVNPVEGGEILDWLFAGSTSNANQVVAYYPTSPAYYPPSPPVQYRTYYGGPPSAAYASLPGQSSVNYPVATSSACCEPTVVYQAASDVCCPTPVVCEPEQPSCWNRITSMFGCGTTSSAAATARSTYRTSWKQIPVTRYRPITSTDPLTGYPVTVMKACTTYAWQPQRQECGFLRRLMGQCDPGPAAVASTCCPDPCLTTQCVVTSDSCGCGASSSVPSMSPTPAAPPYYAPGAVPAPGGNAPSPAVPGTPPTLSPPPATSPLPTNPEPAETRPSLVPGSEGAQSGVASPPGLSTTTPAFGAPSLGSATGEQAASDAAAGSPSVLSKPVPLPTFGPRAATPQKLDLNPVPDPDAVPTKIDQDSSSPQLLNPRDQVALLRSHQSWAVTTITWPTTARHAERPASFATPEPRPVRPALDESGWYSVAR